MMTTAGFSTTILVDQSPKEAFEAIKNVRGWWSGLHQEEFEGASQKVNDEFTFRAGGGAHYSKQKLVELIPDEKVVWEVTDSQLSFLENQTEWIGTRISFALFDEGNQTRIVFTHLGLVPEFECYDSCTPAWTQYVQEKLTKWIANDKS